MNEHFSLVIPTHHRERIYKQNEMYRRIKETAGNMVEVIAVSDNPEIYDRVMGDKIVKLPNWVGWTKQMNIAEKFASYDTVGHMDDSCTILEKNWASLALEMFDRLFPDGMGVVEVRGCKDCWSRGISSRKYLYSLNLGNMFWPEYLHGGDEEIYARSKDNFFYFKKPLVKETKFKDSSGKVVSQLIQYNEELYNKRLRQDFPLKFQSDWLENSKKYEIY